MAARIRFVNKHRRMNVLPPLDLAALAFFLVAWAGYAIGVEWREHRSTGLNARMHRYREVWMRRALARDPRIVDTHIMSALQYGTAFFASTTLIAIGGVAALLRSPEELQSVIVSLPFGIRATPTEWQIKAIGLICVFVYAFFKFAWAYRLFNYVAIMIGAMPPPADKNTPEAEVHVMRTARLFQAAGAHFNRGQRAFFFALGYLGWFAGPLVMMASTAAVVIVMWRRQFASAAQRALMIEAKDLSEARELSEPKDLRSTAAETAPRSSP